MIPTNTPGAILVWKGQNVGKSEGITNLPTLSDFAEAVRWMDGFDARCAVSQRKRGWRLPGRLRLGRLRLWQAFAGLS